VDYGGLSANASVHMVLDATPPTLTIWKPIADQNVKRSNTTVAWNMIDAFSGIASVRISVDGGAFQTLRSDQKSYDVSGLEDGEHTVTVRVSDRAGNTKDASVTFSVSTEAGISAVTAGVIVLVVVIAVIAAVLLMKRRKPVVAEPPKKEGKS
jgi:predicted phage tail protein